jgi:4,5-DOPA dioxygenase extradiol
MHLSKGTLSRRAVLALGAAAVLRSKVAWCEDEVTPAPAIFVSHGSPLFLPGNEARVAELRAWGATLKRPRGVVVMTPHFAARQLQIGASGPGFAMYNLPGGIKRRLPQDLEYATPASNAVAARLDALLGPGVARPERRGFDHSSWMPMKALLPRADVPMVELGYSYITPKEAFALGKKLAPLRDEGVLFVASGGMTHNLAAAVIPGDGAASVPAPSWAREFDAWAAERLLTSAVDDLIDYRNKAPGAELAHPDDGAHFRVLLVALGVALFARAPSKKTRFPVTGFESALAKRCVELG